MISLVTVDDCLDYLSERNMELRGGASGRGKWWAKLVMFAEPVVEGKGVDLLSAIKDAISKWEARS